MYSNPSPFLYFEINYTRDTSAEEGWGLRCVRTMQTKQQVSLWKWINKNKTILDMHTLDFASGLHVTVLNSPNPSRVDIRLCKHWKHFLLLKYKLYRKSYSSQTIIVWFEYLFFLGEQGPTFSKILLLGTFPLLGPWQQFDHVTWWDWAACES